jgi:hypothetical protein
MPEQPSIPRAHCNWSEQLTQSGIAGVADAFTSQDLDYFNDRLGPLLFAQRGGPGQRAYIEVDTIAHLGLLERCLNSAVQALIASVTPNARIYHCHVYEIDEQMEQPHIHADRADGWHRDVETLRHYDVRHAGYISLFVYLSAVDLDSGAFEFLPRIPTDGLPRVAATCRVVGPPGTTFAWNRSYYHRASPNLSATRRRVLKLSWQDAHLPNDRIGGEGFRLAAKHVAHDQFLRTLFATETSSSLPFAGLPPPPSALPLNSSLTLRRSDQLIEHARLFGHRVSR